MDSESSIPEIEKYSHSGNSSEVEEAEIFPSIPYIEFISGITTINELDPGTTITGIPNLDALDRLSNAARVKMIHAVWKESQKDRRLIGGRTSPGDFVKKYFAEKHFNGKIQDINLTAIPVDISQYNKPSEQIYQQHSFSFLLDIGLASTGRNPGRLAIQSTLAQIEGTTFNYEIPKYKVIAGQTGEDILNKLIDDSKLGWEAAQRLALTRIVSGGLPSLGKRR